MNEQGTWQADPSGRHEYRYWDGVRWTDNVSDQGRTSVDPSMEPAARPVAPPSTVAKPKRKKWPWVLGAIVLVFGLGVAGCLAAVNNAVDELNREQAAHAITKAQFDTLALGISRAEVISQLGREPEDVQEFVHQGVLSEAQVNDACIYYNREGGSFGDRFQLCFTDDKLDAKNAY
jgi:hypothetical protein